MSIIAIYNIKGGVGKTATAVNIAYLAACAGHKTLICDLDPQSATTFYLRVKPKVKRGVDSLTKGKKLSDSIKGSDFEGLDLLPADFSFRNLDVAFDGLKRSKKRLRDTLKPLRDEYDLIILDAPPNLTLLSENIFHAADWVLSPVAPTTLSQRMHERLIEFYQEEDLDTSRIMGFFSMVESRKKLHKETIEDMRKAHTGLLETEIPYLSDVERMGVHREPTPYTAPSSAAAKAYHRLWAEVQERMVS